MTAMIPLLAVMFTLLALFLFVPFHLKLKGRYEDGFAGTFAISWLWEFAEFYYGKDGIRILAAGIIIFRKTRKEQLREKGRKERPKKGRKEKSKRWILIHFPFVFATAREFFRTLCPEGRIKGIVGLGDPAETGMFMGIVAGCLSCLPLPFLTIVPEFEKERFNMEGWITLRVLLASIFALCMRFVLSREGREIIQEL
jgi:hypothetical protein